MLQYHGLLMNHGRVFLWISWKWAHSLKHGAIFSTNMISSASTKLAFTLFKGTTVFQALARGDYNFLQYDHSLEWSQLVAINKLVSPFQQFCRFVESRWCRCCLNLTLTGVSLLHPLLWCHTIGVSKILVHIKGVTDSPVVSPALTLGQEVGQCSSQEKPLACHNHFYGLNWSGWAEPAEINKLSLD